MIAIISTLTLHEPPVFSGMFTHLCQLLSLIQQLCDEDVRPGQLGVLQMLIDLGKSHHFTGSCDGLDRWLGASVSGHASNNSPFVTLSQNRFTRDWTATSLLWIVSELLRITTTDTVDCLATLLLQNWLRTRQNKIEATSCNRSRWTDRTWVVPLRICGGVLCCFYFMHWQNPGSTRPIPFSSPSRNDRAMLDAKTELDGSHLCCHFLLD